MKMVNIVSVANIASMTSYTQKKESKNFLTINTSIAYHQNKYAKKMLSFFIQIFPINTFI